MISGTNTYLLGTGQNRILIDTGEGKASWLRSLIGVLSREHVTVSTVLLTHWHQDHVQGVAPLLTLFPTASHPPAIAARPRIFKHMPAHCPSITDAASRAAASIESWEPIEGGQTFTVEGATLRAVHSPGHTEDHMAFVLEEENALFTGDNVLGHGTAVFEDLTAYIKSVEKMGGLIDGRAYPGHGAVIEDGKAKCVEYLVHRKEREKQVVGVLKKNDGKANGWTSMEIVKVVYKDVPENLHLPAEGGVKQVLEKLRREGRVSIRNTDDEDTRWRLSDDSSL